MRLAAGRLIAYPALAAQAILAAIRDRHVTALHEHVGEGHRGRTA